MFNFENKTYLVTGASSGIGMATSVQLSKHGAKVILVSRDKDSIIKNTIPFLKNNNYHIVTADLSEIADMPKWLKEISCTIGPINGLIHCAGQYLLKPLQILKQADIEKIMKINVTVGIELARSLRQKSVCAENGSIIYLSSIVSESGGSGVAAYAASKGAVKSMVKSLAIELARDKIRVNSVMPGMVKTPMFDKIIENMSSTQISELEQKHLLGFGSPENIAHAIMFLLSDYASWITGTNLVVDGGYTSS